jgi:phage shock protein A
VGSTSRLFNMWKGFVSLFVGGVEQQNPEIVYENAIHGLTEKYTTLKGAAAGLVKRRIQLEEKISRTKHDSQDLQEQIDTAVSLNDDESALHLLNLQSELEKELTDAEKELAQAANDADSAKAALRTLEAEIEKLKAERDRTIAQIKGAEARKHIQEQLDGLSIDDDIKALDNVREYAQKVKAEVKINDELKGSSMDGKLQAIKEQTQHNKAQQKLEALKAQRASKLSENKEG